MNIGLKFRILFAIVICRYIIWNLHKRKYDVSFCILHRFIKTGTSILNKCTIVKLVICCNHHVFPSAFVHQFIFVSILCVTCTFFLNHFRVQVSCRSSTTWSFEIQMFVLITCIYLCNVRVSF